MRLRFVAAPAGDARRHAARASFVIFGALYLAPGEPDRGALRRQDAAAGGMAVLEERYHLNEPFLAQYWHWLTRALHGDLGSRSRSGENVSTLIATAGLDTAELVAVRLGADPACSGSGSGILAGLRRGAVGHGVLAAHDGLRGDPVVRGGDRADPASSP